MMADLILHHYPTSPFAEKVRLIMGYKKLAWKSVIIPMIMPKPDMVVLTGGYRKTPVLQIGADIYCDTALICDVLEHLQPEPSLYPEPSKGMGRTLAQWADTTLFWTAMAYNFQPPGIAQVFGNAPPEAAKAFADDRQAMRQGMPRMPAADSAAAYKSYLRRMSDMLDDWPFLLGTSPSVADFAAYHVALFGDPGSNRWIAKMQSRLPVQWSRQQIRVGEQNFAAAEHVPAFIYPNPLQPNRYVVINSGLTIDEREYHGDYSMPNLGDLAILTVQSGGDTPDVVFATLFDEQWRLTR